MLFSMTREHVTILHEGSTSKDGWDLSGTSRTRIDSEGLARAVLVSPYQGYINFCYNGLISTNTGLPPEGRPVPAVLQGVTRTIAPHQ
jgi:hypothetical protein